MTQIYFICGFIGSGKTTYSKRLAESKQAFRFSIDEWMIPLYGEHMEREVFDNRLAALQDLFKQAALQLTTLGVPVIFDFGFWTKQDRQHFKSWAQSNDLTCEIHYLDASYDICQKRAIHRNAELQGKSYEMTTKILELFWPGFEIPSKDEKVIWV